MFISCFFLAYSCVSEEDILQTEKIEQEKKAFAIFSQSSNIQGKSNKSAIDYANGFSILMQRYDSIHNTNISGLVNTTNIVEHKKNSLQNVIVESKEFYIENRLHSQTIFEENGDVWVMYPKIKNNSVEDLLIVSYTDNGTNVFFRYVKKNSELYVNNIKLFQEKFDKQINRIISNKSNSDLCGYGDDVCELDDVIIIGGGGSSGGCVGCESNPPLNPGGGCEPFVECIAPPDNGGGGPPSTNIYSENDPPPSCKSFDFKKVNNTFQEAGVKNIGQIFLAKTASGKYASVSIYIGELYFNLPVTRLNGEFYSTGRASKISAEALGKAFKETDAYFKQNPFATNISIEQQFLNNLRNEMNKYGGSTSRTPSQGAGYKPNVRDFRNYWFLDEPSCWN